LETRRKRRVSGLVKDSAEASEPEAVPESTNDEHLANNTLKAGNKRKLSVREDEASSTTLGRDDFSFNRKGDSGDDSAIQKPLKSLPQRGLAKTWEKRDETPLATKASRKALGESRLKATYLSLLIVSRNCEYRSSSFPYKSKNFASETNP
jgi:hypothetical protein